MHLGPSASKIGGNWTKTASSTTGRQKQSLTTTGGPSYQKEIKLCVVLSVLSNLSDAPASRQMYQNRAKELVRDCPICYRIRIFTRCSPSLDLKITLRIRAKPEFCGFLRAISVGVRVGGL